MGICCEYYLEDEVTTDDPHLEGWKNEVQDVLWVQIDELRVASCKVGKLSGIDAL